MKTLYLDCSMGASGDMLAAALLELVPGPDRFVEELNRLGIPGVSVKKEVSIKCGVTGTHLAVAVNGEEEESADAPRHGEHLPGAGHPPGEHLPGADHPPGEHIPGADHFPGEHLPGADHPPGESIPGAGHPPGEHIPGADHPPGEHLPGAGHPPGEHIPEKGAPAHPHHHSSLHEIEHIVKERLHLPLKVEEDVMAVYRLIAEAEGKVHGVPVAEIHFHEVGTMDAIADIAAVCLLMYEINPDRVVVSPVHVGSGQVRCAHGILPVPAPATAYILQGVPIYGGQIKGELCTPTGAALLKYFADSFGDMPVMKTTAIGYGMGKKDFEAANCVRAMLGEAPDPGNEEICELRFHVDDMTAEEAGFAMERLFDSGALDVFTIPAGMKKSRPGILITVICRESDKEEIIRTAFRHTTTLGIRENKCRRYVLDRRMETADTPYGPVRRKLSSGYGVRREKYEYDDLSRVARDEGISIEEAAELAAKFFPE